VSFGCFGTLGMVLSRGKKGSSGGALFAGKVSMAERGQRAFKRVLCALGERIGKRGGKGREWVV
jgi:hypothetical protein